MHKRENFTDNRLFCPGPTPAPRAVVQAYEQTNIYHRGKDFELIFNECAQRLQPFFGCKNLPILLTSSGSGAMEAAVTNFTADGDAVIVLSAGKFGDRWAKICSAYGCDVHIQKKPLGTVPDRSDVEAAFKAKPRAKAVFFQCHETSTGAKLPVEELVDEIKKRSKDCLIIVDAISSLGAHSFNMDQWGVDVALSGSQKGFGVGPGLAFIALSDRALANISKRQRFYFDLLREKNGQANGRASFTPAISLVLGLHAALLEIEDLGPRGFAKHHERMGNAARSAVKAMGLELFVEPRAVSNTLTAIKVPHGVDGAEVLARSKQRYGAVISGGQDELKGKIIRFSHLGFVSPFHLIDGLAALEFSLADCGFVFPIGSGVSAAMQSLRSSQTH